MVTNRFAVQNGNLDSVARSKEKKTADKENSWSLRYFRQDVQIYSGDSRENKFERYLKHRVWDFWSSVSSNLRHNF